MNSGLLMEWADTSGAFYRAEMLALLLLLVGFQQLFAQVPSPETLEQKRPGDISDLNAPILKFRQSSETGAVEPVQRAPAPDMFTLYTAQSYYHTDNLFLTAPNPQSANAWVGALGISFVPYSTYRWTPRFSVEEALVRFDRVSRVDYSAQMFAFDNRLGLTDNNLLSWDFNVSARRLEGDRSGLGEFYKRVESVNNLNWFLPLDHTGQWLLHASPGFAWRSAHRAFEDRFDTGAVVSVLWLPNQALAFQPFFEGGYGYYPNDSATLAGRRDVHLRGGVNFLWRISNNASVGASAYWAGNYSSAEGADYQILPCLMLNGRFGF